MSTTSTTDAEPYEALLNLARALASLHAARDFEELAGRVEHLGERCAGAVMTAVLVADPAGELRLITGSLRRPALLETVRKQLGIDRVASNPDVASAWIHVMSTRRPQWFDVAELFDGAEDAAAPRRCIMAPMWIDSEALGGCLAIVPETPANTTLVSLLAEHAGTAFGRLRELKQARQLRGIDPDLWVSDEALFREALRRELSRGRRYGGNVGLTLVRVACEDDLRARYGDFYTKHMLRRIGGRLASLVRDTDVLGALDSGFGIIQPGTPLGGVRIAADRLIHEIGEMLAEHYPELELSLIGRIEAVCASSPDHGATADELIGYVQGASMTDEESAAA